MDGARGQGQGVARFAIKRENKFTLTIHGQDEGHKEALFSPQILIFSTTNTAYSCLQINGALMPNVVPGIQKK